MPKDIKPLQKDLLEKWHPTLNGDTSPQLVSAGSGRSFWWLCDKGHEWQATPLNLKRTGKCPICSNHKILVGYNDLATTNPRLAVEWHPKLNGNLTPKDITDGYTKKVWWLCDKGHEWEMAVYRRKNNSHLGCVYCSGNQPIVGETDLSTTHPNLGAEWHPTLNGNKLPTHFMSGSSKKVWWLCNKGHEWQAIIYDRSKGTGCPICSNNRLLIGYNDLSTTNPALAAEWHPTLNGNRLPTHFIAGSNCKVWWLCDKGHEWQAVIDARNSGTGCPVCTNRIILPGFNDLATLKPNLVKEWHSKNLLTSQQVSVSSGKNVWWLCDKGHEWQAVIASRSSGGGCPVCSNKKVLKGYNDLATTYPNLIEQWHPIKNENENIENYSYGSEFKAWWLCNKGHEWQAAIKERKRFGCPTCVNLKLLVGYNDLASVYPLLAKEWHPTLNGDLLPVDITSGTNVKVWWLCDKGHEWQTSPSKRGLMGRNCPICAAHTFQSKGEKEIGNYIKNLNREFEIKLNSRLYKTRHELDIYIPEKNIAIEFNGIYWHSEIHKDKLYHYHKWLACKNQGIQLIQIWEDEWSYNPDQVKKMLTHKLGLNLKDVIYARKTVIKLVSKSYAEDFLENNHIQGYVNGSIILGLYELETLVAVMVLKKTSNSDGKSLDLLRYATNKNVIGGFTKLLKYVEKTYSPNKIITFSDNCVSDGALYKNTGFIADKELPPDYMYVVKGERKHKFGYRLNRFKTDPNLKYEEHLSERELAVLNGLPRIWDAGKVRWVKTID